MTPLLRFPLIASIAFGLMTTSCAASRPTWTVAPPRLTLPQMAVQPCALHRLPQKATLGDLEAGYMIRGRQIADCDTARRLAVETLIAERAASDSLRR